MIDILNKSSRSIILKSDLVNILKGLNKCSLHLYVEMWVKCLNGDMVLIKEHMSWSHNLVMVVRRKNIIDSNQDEPHIS